MIFPAHIRVIDGEEQVQPVPIHLCNVAKCACTALSDISLTNSAHLASLLHDGGKLTAISAAYQYAVAREPEKATRGFVSHSLFSTRLLLEHFHDRQSPSGYAPLTAELLAYAAGAHHGLFDCVDMQSHSGFMHRITKEGINYEEARDNFFASCATPEGLDKLFAAAESEVQTVYKRIVPLLKDPQNQAEADFYLGLLARLLLSAVIDGDRRDAAKFMQNITFPVFPQGEKRRLMWKTLLARVESKSGNKSIDMAINRARCILSDRCCAQSECPSGVYRISLPVGADRTKIGLRLALAHAAERDKSRIVYLSPLSAFNHSARVIRDCIQDDSLILEHDYNILHPRNIDEVDELDPLELLAENWNAPIVISTLTRFLDVLYSGKTSCIRRFQALCSSVIIIDEVQTVPIHLLTLFNLAINFLAEVCGATVILMSATQPCLEQTVHPLASVPEELVLYDSELWHNFQRIKLIDAGKRTLDSLPDFACSVLEASGSLLVICNKEDEVAQLYRALQGRDILCFQLFASMCAAHRRKVLNKLNTALRDPKRPRKIVCISTQAIEADMNISFSAAIHFLAGLDSIMQIANYCNGDSNTPFLVYLVQCLDEDLQNLPAIRDAQNATITLLHAFSKDPARFDNDLTSYAAIRYYFTARYTELIKCATDGPVKIGQKTYTLFNLLSSNECFCDSALDNAFEGFALRQAFKTAGEYFSVLEDNTTDILVPYEKGADCITDLCALHEPYPLNKLSELLQQAKPYTVSIYEWQKKKLQEQGALVPLCGGHILALKSAYYNSDIGLILER